MRNPTMRFTLWITALATLAVSAQGVAADRKPVLEYVKPGAEVEFVSAKQAQTQGLDGRIFMLDRWSEFTTEEIANVERSGERISLTFKEGGFSGQGPCNTLTGTFSLENERFQLGPVGRSKKMCDNADVMAVEDKLVTFLSQVTGKEQSGTKLILFTGDGREMTFWSAEITSAPPTEND